jgi:YD repeat-containing protein
MKSQTVNYPRKRGNSTEWGKPKEVTDANQQITKYDYDDFWREKAIDYPDGGQAKTEYHDYASQQDPQHIIRLRKEKSGEDLRPVSYQYYDGLGRPIQTSVPAPRGRYSLTSTVYNNEGQKAQVVGPFEYTSASFIGHPYSNSGPCGGDDLVCRNELFLYEAGRVQSHSLTLKQQGSGYFHAITNYSYDVLTRTTTDPDGKVKNEKFDDLGKVVQITDAAGATKYSYNAIGELLSVTGPSGKSIKFTYDLRGKKTRFDDPDRGSWSYEYDKAGNITKTTGPDGQTIENVYDGLNRTVKVTATKPGVCTGQGCQPGTPTEPPRLFRRLC